MRGGGSGGKGSIYSFSSFFSGPSLVETCNAFWTLCSLPFLQYVKYQDQNPPPKLDFNADRTSRRYIAVLFFLFSMRLPLPGILISSCSRPSDGEKRRCGGSTEMLQWFLLCKPSIRSSPSIHLIIFVRFFFRQLFQEPIPLIPILIKISAKFDLFLFFLIPGFPLV